MSRRTKKQKKLDILESDQFKGYVRQAVELINKGWRSPEVYADIVSVWPEHNHFYHKELMDRAYRVIRDTLHKDRQYIFQLHMQRYEELFKQMMVMEDVANRPLDPKKDWQTVSHKLNSALRILKQKEDLVGLHSKDVVIEIENNNTTVIHQEGDKIKLDNLSLVEKIELLDMLKQIRVTPIEGERQIVIKKKVLGEDNEVVEQRRVITATDVQYEEMPEGVVDKMKVDPGKQVVHYIEAPVVEDHTGGLKKGKTLKDVQEMIDTGIKEKFERLMKRTVKK